MNAISTPDGQVECDFLYLGNISQTGLNVTKQENITVLIKRRCFIDIAAGHVESSFLKLGDKKKRKH